MVYALLLNHKIYGLYETIDLVRLNMMIILFYNLEKGKVKVAKYENLMDYLRSPSFSEETFHVPEFNREVKKLGIRVDYFNVEKNGSTPLEYIMNHVNWRFMELEKKMKHDGRIKITIPGENKEDHRLGNPYFDNWRWVDPENWECITSTLHNYISKKIGELEKKFKNRVRFGEVLYENANEHSYQLWSANAANWCLPEGEEIPGKFQAEEMKFQGPGVYGIVVTPLYGYHDLVPSEYEFFESKN
jgi:ribosome-associated translation inhibitor RaiA